MKELEWDYIEVVTREITVMGFNELLGTNLVGAQKLLIVILPTRQGDNEYQLTNQSISNTSINNLNIEIESKDFFNTSLQNDHEAYRQLVDCFNTGGNDMNTGSLLPMDLWRTHF